MTPPSTRRRRSPGEGGIQPTDRVVRLLLASGAWEAIADSAGAADTTAARYAGEALEAAARALGWRAG